MDEWFVIEHSNYSLADLHTIEVELYVKQGRQGFAKYVKAAMDSCNVLMPSHVKETVGKFLEGSAAEVTTSFVVSKVESRTIHMIKARRLTLPPKG